MAVQWVFDPAPPSGRATGNVAELLFSGGTSGFVRETLQNANDQQLDPAVPVAVTYRIELFEGSPKEELLQAIRWAELQPHLTAVVSDGGGAARLSSATQRMASRTKPILCVTIEDRHTQGLSGSEFEDGANYKSLVKDEFHQGSAARLKGRGGSWGLGKAAAFGASGISTVIFSSTVPRGTASSPELRVIGRTYLPSHSVGSARFEGGGWLGAPEPQESGTASVSLWGEPAGTIAAPLRLSRQGLPRGTSIMVLDFFDASNRGLAKPSLEVVRSLAEQFRGETIHWFWPALHRGSLSVTVEQAHNGETLRSEPVDITSSPQIAPFLLAADAATGAAPGDAGVAQQVPVEIPARKDAKNRSTAMSTARLRIVRLPATGNRDIESLANTIAFVRGAGMVVRYFAPARKDADNPYYGLLEVGLASQAGPAGEAAEEFFRAAEPPSHEDWTVRGSKLAELYSNTAPLQGLFGDLEKAIRAICTQPADNSKKGPKDLAKRFPMGAGGTPTVSREITVSWPTPLPMPDWECRTLTVTGAEVRWSADPATGAATWGFRLKAYAKGYGRSEKLGVDIDSCAPGEILDASRVAGIPMSTTAVFTCSVNIPPDIPTGTIISLECQPA